MGWRLEATQGETYTDDEARSILGPWLLAQGQQHQAECAEAALAWLPCDEDQDVVLACFECGWTAFRQDAE